MKINKLSQLTLLLLLSISTFAQSNRCQITGKIENASGPVKIYIYQDKSVDSVVANNSTFKFERNVDSNNLEKLRLEIVYLGTGRNIDKTPYIFLSPGNISILINDQLEEEMIMKLAGPRLTIDYYEKLYTPVKHYNDLIMEFKYKLQEALKNRNGDSIFFEKQKIEYVKKCFSIPRTFILENPSSILSIQALYMMGSGDPTAASPKKELELLYNLLSTSIKRSNAGRMYERKLKAMV